MSKNIYGEDINFDELEQHVYEDEDDDVFYICPICGGEYLDTFITEHNGQTMCIDCLSEKNGDQFMSNLGGYQDIVVEAHKAGGTDIWLDTIKKAAYNAGATDMKNTLVAPLLAAGVGIGMVGTIVYKKITKWISDKKKEKLLTEKEAQEAEKYLKQELDTAIEELEAEVGGENN